MLTREEKKQFVQEMRKKIQTSKSTVFCNFEKINTKRQRDLKSAFKQIRGEISIVKRRLLQRALMEEKIEFPEIIGPVMVGISDDEISSAKILKKFPEKKEEIEFIGGILKIDKQYTVLTKEDLQELAILPTKEEILARLIGSLRGPLFNIYSILRGNIRKFNYILANIRE